MEDLIKREDAIKAIAEYFSDDDDSHWNAIATYIIKDIPSAEKQGEWIPCSERLPEKNGFYLVTADHEHDRELRSTDIYSFVNGDWYTIHDDIIAWMPLPEPWKGSDDERTT